MRLANSLSVLLLLFASGPCRTENFDIEKYIAEKFSGGRVKYCGKYVVVDKGAVFDGRVYYLKVCGR